MICNCEQCFTCVPHAYMQQVCGSVLKWLKNMTDCKSESFSHPRTKNKKTQNKNNELLNFFLFVIPLPPSRAAIFVCWMWAPGATTICWIRSFSPPLNVSLQQGLFWCKWRRICLWHGPFVWKMPPRAETDADSCLLCHSKWQFLSLTLSSSLSLLSLRVLTLNKCNSTGPQLNSYSFFIFLWAFNGEGGIIIPVCLLNELCASRTSNFFLCMCLCVCTAGYFCVPTCPNANGYNKQTSKGLTNTPVNKSCVLWRLISV